MSNHLTEDEREEIERFLYMASFQIYAEDAMLAEEAGTDLNDVQAIHDYMRMTNVDGDGKYISDLNGLSPLQSAAVIQLVWMWKELLGSYNHIYENIEFHAAYYRAIMAHKLEIM